MTMGAGRMNKRTLRALETLFVAHMEGGSQIHQSRDRVYDELAADGLAEWGAAEMPGRPPVMWRLADNAQGALSLLPGMRGHRGITRKKTRFMLATIDYTNYRGERAARLIKPETMRHMVSERHGPEARWMLIAEDVDKGAVREFAMANVHRFRDGDCQFEMSCTLFGGGKKP